MSVSTIDSEEPILEHRRLRFSFQINDFKDREPPERPDRLAPGCGGGGDVVASVVGVKRSVENFFTGPPESLERPVGGGSGVSREASFPCQPNFRSFFPAVSPVQGNQAAKRQRETETPPRGRPTIRSKARNLTEDIEGSKNLEVFISAWIAVRRGASRSVVGPFPSEAAIYEASCRTATLKRPRVTIF